MTLIPDASVAIKWFVREPLHEEARTLLEEALDLALALRHPVCDCIYLALARREDAVLVTADERLHRVVAASAQAPLVRLLGPAAS